ncbi:MAG: NAD(P)/FAD-dependent oxidoreductase [Opitutales bacterium]|jgi:hypothetical protein|nr:NAD(P)/FAD-dependent oxidoreductase [Opitutales bacterium]
MNFDTDVCIVGAGIAGLRCAMELQDLGFKVIVLEAGDEVGGRIRTDTIDGFQLDRGFQVLLTAYPECARVLDFERLNLGMFEPGAWIWTGSKLAQVIDPWRRPAQALQAAMSPVGTFKDKWKVACLRNRLSRTSIEALYRGDESTTIAYLESLGFTISFIEAFFRPFYSGIFLEKDLNTANSMFEFVFKMFGKGYAALPARGMQAIPNQLLKRLHPDTVRFDAPVVSITSDVANMESGSSVNARAVVLATDMSKASQLTSGLVVDRGWNATQCYYFSADESPLPSPMIGLNGMGKGCINNIAVPSDASPNYAPEGKSLICVSTYSVIESSVVRSELKSWFGSVVDDWSEIRSYMIPQSLPRQSPGDNAYGRAVPCLENGVWLCGDYCFSSSTEGAMQSGRMVGAMVAEQLSQN